MFDRLRIATFTLILTTAATANAAVVCVPNDAIDGSCTGGMGAATVSAGVALASLGGGDTVLVAPGTYVENVTIDRNLALLSTGGRAVTTIQGISGRRRPRRHPRVEQHDRPCEIGGVGQGFTIVGIDNGSPGIENAAVYFQGNHSNAQVLDNEIVANGDAGLMTEFGARHLRLRHRRQRVLGTDLRRAGPRRLRLRQPVLAAERPAPARRDRLRRGLPQHLQHHVHEQRRQRHRRRHQRQHRRAGHGG